MANDYFNHSANVVPKRSRGVAAHINNVAQEIATGLDKLPTEQQLKRNTIAYAVSTGSNNSYNITLPYVFGLTDGAGFSFKANHTNTGAVAINVNGLGLRSIVYGDGSALGADAITAGQLVTVRYDVTNARFQLMSNAPGIAAAAAASAAAADASAIAALASEVAAAASYDSFDDRYLGAKATDPALDNDGDALLTGAMYFNTSTGMRIYDGTAWTAIPTLDAAFSTPHSDTNMVAGASTGGSLLAGALNNILIGKYAGGSITTNDDNIAIGTNALSRITSTSNGNVAIGYTAGMGQSSVSGHNVAIGRTSMGAAFGNAGSYNVAIGSNAMFSMSANSNNQYNVAIGAFTLDDSSMSTAAYNVIVGGQAGRNITTGQANTGIGFSSLGSFNEGLETGSFNVAIGLRAGYTANGASSRNVFIGSAQNVNSGNYGAGPSAFGLVNDKLYIHNGASDTPLIYGDFAASQLEFNAVTTTFNGAVNITGTPTVSSSGMRIYGGGTGQASNGWVSFTDNTLAVQGSIEKVISTDNVEIKSWNGNGNIKLTPAGAGLIDLPANVAISKNGASQISLTDTAAANTSYIHKSGTALTFEGNFIRMQGPGLTFGQYQVWDGSAWQQLMHSGGGNFLGNITFNAGATIPPSQVISLQSNAGATDYMQFKNTVSQVVWAVQQDTAGKLRLSGVGNIGATDFELYQMVSGNAQFGIHSVAGEAELRMITDGAQLDEKNWGFITNAGNLELRAWDDGFSNYTSPLLFTRAGSGLNVSNLAIGSPATINGTLTLPTTAPIHLSNAASTTGLLIDSDGSKRISWNDGAGNFNIRNNSHYHTAAERYVVGGGGATKIQCNADSANGQIDLMVAAIGAAADDPITWSNTLSIYTNEIMTRTRLRPSGAGLHDIGDPTFTYKDLYLGGIGYMGELEISNTAPSIFLMDEGSTGYNFEISTAGAWLYMRHVDEAKGFSANIMTYNYTTDITTFTGKLQENGKDVVTTEPPVTGHVRSGNTQLVNGAHSSSTLAINPVVTHNTWESIGPTGSGADNIWTALDQLPANASAVIIDIYGYMSQAGAAAAVLSAYATSGDVVSPVADAINNRIYAFQIDNDGITGIHAMMHRVTIPLNSLSVFKLLWVVSGNGSVNIIGYYRGFMTD